MNSDGDKRATTQLNERLATSGLRSTVQRQHVYDVLLQERDHPTAEEVFFRTRQLNPEISMATVYNCLDTLVKCNLVRQVKMDRGATRFCPNMREHGHFHCDECGQVYDIDLPDKNNIADVLPEGFRLTHADLSFRGLCRNCSGK